MILHILLIYSFIWFNFFQILNKLFPQVPNKNLQSLREKGFATISFNYHVTFSSKNHEKPTISRIFAWIFNWKLLPEIKTIRPECNGEKNKKASNILFHVRNFFKLSRICSGVSWKFHWKNRTSQETLMEYFWTWNFVYLLSEHFARVRQ